MILGFIGTGGITEAITTGLCKCSDHAEDILISKRSQFRSRRLATFFPQVKVLDDNQSIVDRSDWVVIAVLPKQTLGLLSTLRFRQNHKIISLPAGINLETLATHVHPATQIYRAIPMPPIEFGMGPTPIYPPDAEVEALFARVGKAVAVLDERQFTALGASSAVMATFFSWIASNARWLEAQGVPAQQSALYATSVFHALAAMATQKDAQGLQLMSENCITPGGLNAQVLNGVQEAQIIEKIQAQIDGVMTRLERANYAIERKRALHKTGEAH